MKMTTTTRHPFGGGFRNPGDTFDAENDQQAATFESLGWARRDGKAEAVKPAAKAPAKAAKKAAKNTYNTRAMKARK